MEEIINVTFEEDAAFDMEYTEMQGGGRNGKSAYEYACDGGYVGTEEEFAAKLAAEVPSLLPNPHPLTLTGAVDAVYDGSEAIAIEIPKSGTVTPDKTLTADGEAADAKAVGDALAGKLSKDSLASAIDTALAEAKASGEFDGEDGADGTDGADGMSNIAKMYLIGILKNAQYSTDQSDNIDALEEALGSSARVQFFTLGQGRITIASSVGYIAPNYADRVSHVGTDVVLVPLMKYRLVGVEGIRYGIQQVSSDGFSKIKAGVDLASSDKSDSGWQTTGYEFTADRAVTICWLTASYESGADISPEDAMPVYIEAVM